jgi:hypothetical protein
MSKDRTIDTLLDVLKQAAADGAEQRLYRSGKLDGLFAGRSGVNGEAAARALRDGLLEVVRTETKGKTRIDWVKLTPRGVQFLAEHESPERILADLRSALHILQEGLPAWQAELRRRLEELSRRLEEDSQRFLKTLEVLGNRVEDALRRLEEARPGISPSLATLVPWARDALTYIEQRRNSGVPADCPLPELFRAVTARYPDLALPAFHDGLRRLHEEKVLRLRPFTAPPAEMPQAEFALLDHGTVFYHVTR